MSVSVVGFPDVVASVGVVSDLGAVDILLEDDHVVKGSVCGPCSVVELDGDSGSSKSCDRTVNL